MSSLLYDQRFRRWSLFSQFKIHCLCNKVIQSLLGEELQIDTNAYIIGHQILKKSYITPTPPQPQCTTKVPRTLAGK